MPLPAEGCPRIAGPCLSVKHFGLVFIDLTGKNCRGLRAAISPECLDVRSGTKLWGRVAAA